MIASLHRNSTPMSQSNTSESRTFPWSVLIQINDEKGPSAQWRLTNDHTPYFELDGSIENIIICSSVHKKKFTIKAKALSYTLLPCVISATEAVPFVASLRYELVKASYIRLMTYWNFTIRATLSINLGALWSYIQANGCPSNLATAIRSLLCPDIIPIQPHLSSWCFQSRLSSPPPLNWGVNGPVIAARLRAIRDSFGVNCDIFLTSNQLLAVDWMSKTECTARHSDYDVYSVPTLAVDSDRHVLFPVTDRAILDIKSAPVTATTASVRLKLHSRGGVLSWPTKSGKKIISIMSAINQGGTTLVVCHQTRLGSWNAILTSMLKPTGATAPVRWTIITTEDELARECCRIGSTILDDPPTPHSTRPACVVVVPSCTLIAAKVFTPFVVQQTRMTPITPLLIRHPWNRLIIDDYTGVDDRSNGIHHMINSGLLLTEWTWLLISKMSVASPDTQYNIINALKICVVNPATHAHNALISSGINGLPLSCILSEIMSRVVLDQPDMISFGVNPHINHQFVNLDPYPFDRLVVDAYRAIGWNHVANACMWDISTNPDNIKYAPNGGLIVPSEPWLKRITALLDHQQTVNSHAASFTDLGLAIAMAPTPIIAYNNVIHYTTVMARQMERSTQIASIRRAHFRMQETVNMSSKTCTICYANLGEDCDNDATTLSSHIVMLPCGHSFHASGCFAAVSKPINGILRCVTCRTPFMPDEPLNLSRRDITELRGSHGPTVVDIVCSVLARQPDAIVVLLTPLGVCIPLDAISRLISAFDSRHIKAVSIRDIAWIHTQRSNVLIATPSEIQSIHSPVEITHIVASVQTTAPLSTFDRIGQTPTKPPSPWLIPRDKQITYTTLVYCSTP